MPAVARAVLAGRPALCSRGRQVRDFIHVADVAGAFATLLDSVVTGAVNIGSGDAVTIAEIARLVGDAAGGPALVRLGALPDRPGEPADVSADVSVLHRDASFRPQFCLSEGVAQTVEWWRTELGVPLTGVHVMGPTPEA